MPRIASVLSSVLLDRDLPSEELQAARLDGETYRIDEGFGMVDVAESPWMRAASLSSIVPPRLIGELSTAAWLHGARDHPPAVHEFCSSATSRYRAVEAPRMRLREVCLGADDTQTIGAITVTVPLRTVIDLLRFRDNFTSADSDAVIRLADVGGFSLRQAESHLLSRRHLPAKVRALERLRALMVLRP